MNANGEGDPVAIPNQWSHALPSTGVLVLLCEGKQALILG
jgi:hypothetical protein